MATKLSRRFVESVTNLLHRYRTDLFFRTTVHIVLLQTILIVVLLIVFWYTLRYLERGLVNTFASDIYDLLTGGGEPQNDLSERLQTITAERFQFAAVIVAVVTLSFGFITTYIALAPTRRSLERKQRFVSNVAHELRTPLAIMRTNTDIALLQNGIDRELRESLESNVEELDRMSKILENLVTLSSVIRTNEAYSDFKEAKLGEIVTSAIYLLHHQAKGRDVQIEYYPYVAVAVTGNAAALEQAVFNVVKNAVEHSPAGSKINVLLEGNGEGYVDLTVSDIGSGISRADLFHVFEPFYRARRSRNRTGSGLGLTLVSEIVQMHRGRITVRSKKGAGTTVIITLPYRSAVAVKSDHPKPEEKSGSFAEVYADFSKWIGKKRNN